jgi:ribosome maturation factor RimP
VLRVFLDQPGGIRLSDCEKMSDKIGAVLDEKDVLAGAYVLEISSPGLDRVLKNEKDFARFKGQKARITVYAPIEGQRHFLGEIIATEKDAVTIQDVSMEKTVRIEMDKIAQARLEPDIDIE